MQTYSYDSGVKPRRKRIYIYIALVITLIVLGIVIVRYFAPTSVEQSVNQLQFDDSVSESEKKIIQDAIREQNISVDGSVSLGVEMSYAPGVSPNQYLEAYLPVTAFYNSKQNVNSGELGNEQLFMPSSTDAKVKSDITKFVDANKQDTSNITIGSVENIETEISDKEIALIPASLLTDKVKLLKMDETGYYLDAFNTGALFRYATFTGDSIDQLASLKLNDLPTKDRVFRVNMTGVTALTRVMQKKLATVSGPLYFSELIGDFLADADITHVSNEVSFRAGCQYSNTLFCSPPEFIETLKDSGVDLVELTGNHNNDNGSIYNQESINLYRSLGMATFGGGINSAEAAKPYLADQKGSKVAFIGYNMADGAGSGAIAGESSAGANFYTEAKAESDIRTAKQNAQFVVVNIQYAECQAYPTGYVEYPECDGPIGGQQEAFRKMIDLGADMVVGSSAHQPQTYEIYNGKSIYYGLGNLYFDQTQWPGTERGIILTHYFVAGKLIQTKLSPTRYDKSLQTRLLDDAESVKLLDRLNAAR